jgi:acetyl-CoA/propionyl-CoA carboxylase biotin carboxyl carrier protein
VLGAAQHAAQPARHAIEVRLTAENPAEAFVPEPGRVTTWRPADGPGVRVDAGIEEGDVIPGDYDSMFAKLMVVAATREAAIERMRRALAETRVAGVQTTLPFYRWLIKRDEFTDPTGAGLSTDLIQRTWDPVPLVAAAALRAAELAAQATIAVQGNVPDGRPPTGDAVDAWWSAGLRERLEAGR